MMTPIEFARRAEELVQEETRAKAMGEPTSHRWMAKRFKLMAECLLKNGFGQGLDVLEKP